MTKETARDIAQALVGRVGEQIDFFAFKDLELSQDDKIKVLKEIKLLCGKMTDRVESKYNIRLGYTTEEIIRKIVS
ncbi:hypothetical protein DSECCO2_604290 [anaerobic digester metagenome]